MPLPPGFAFDDAAAFICTYGTSHHALHRPRRAARPARRCWCSGAAGGVGTAAIQIAKAAGARVIAARVERRQVRAVPRARRRRDDQLHAAPNLREALKALTDGKGPDVVYDPVGGDLAEPVFRSIAWRGRYLVVGFAQGSIPALPLNLALLKGASIVGVFWGEFARREPQAQCARRWRARAVVRARAHQAGDRHAPADGAAARGLCAHGQPAGARQAGADQC